MKLEALNRLVQGLGVALALIACARYGAELDVRVRTLNRLIRLGSLDTLGRSQAQKRLSIYNFVAVRTLH